MAELVCRASDPGWLEARRAGVTATDIVTLAGLATWDSPFALYWRKKGRLPEVEQTPRMRLGIWLEQGIAQEWSEAHPADDLEDGGLYRSTDRPWQLATPDYLIACKPDSYCGFHGVLEVKTASSRDGWGDDGTADVPARVRAQVLWQMDVMGVDRGYVAVCFLPSGEIRSYTIHQHPDDMEALRVIGKVFWDRFLDDQPPPVDGLPATTEALKDLHAGYQPKTGKLIRPGLAIDYMKACDQYKNAEQVKRLLENAIRDELGTAMLAEWAEGVFARREVYKRREYTVAAGMVDRLVRIKPKETDHA